MKAGIVINAGERPDQVRAGGRVPRMPAGTACSPMTRSTSARTEMLRPVGAARGDGRPDDPRAAGGDGLRADRRRPWKVAREALTIDHLSAGRLVLPVGLGALDDQASPTSARRPPSASGRRSWTRRSPSSTACGAVKPFRHQGVHYRFGPMTFLPRPVQRPRIPIWVVAVPAGERSMARAARWDGLVLQTGDPVEIAAHHRARPAAADRAGPAWTPSTSWPRARRPPMPAAARAIAEPVAEAGATWWIEADWTAATLRLPARPDRRRTTPGILSRMSRTIDLATPIERAFLIAVDTGDDAGWTAEDSLAELASLADTAGAVVVGAEWQNRRHVDPNWYLGKGKVGGAGHGQGGDRLHAAHRRRRAQAQPAEVAGVRAGRQDPRPQRPDPGHLRPARAHARGSAPGRAGPAGVPAAAPDPPVDAPVAHRRWHRLPGPRREPAGDRPPHHPDQDQQAQGARRGTSRQQRETTARARDRRLVPTVAIVGYTNAGKSSMLNALAGQEAARGRGPAVRDARPDQPLGQARRRPVGHPDRHRGLHPQAAAPARRRVPGDARGGHPRRRAAGGRGRVRPACRRAPPDRPGCAR